MVFHLLVILVAAALYWQHRNYEKPYADQTTQKDFGGIIKDIANDQLLLLLEPGEPQVPGSAAGGPLKRDFKLNSKKLGGKKIMTNKEKAFNNERTKNVSKYLRMMLVIITMMTVAG